MIAIASISDTKTQHRPFCVGFSKQEGPGEGIFTEKRVKLKDVDEARRMVAETIIRDAMSDVAAQVSFNNMVLHPDHPRVFLWLCTH